ncbi:MAG: hypothetical protein JXA25_00035 [Anaerolineales bacterium]|nr:hypothetical protein [Anaerolineales bacterium]
MRTSRTPFLILVSVVVLLAVSCGNQAAAVEPQSTEPSTSDAEAPAEEPANAAAETPAEALVRPATDAETLLNDRCSVCHSVDRVINKAMSLEAWVSTIDRMVQKGAELSDAERDILAAYLAETAGQ